MIASWRVHLGRQMPCAEDRASSTVHSLMTGNSTSSAGSVAFGCGRKGLPSWEPRQGEVCALGPGCADDQRLRDHHLRDAWQPADPVAVAADAGPRCLLRGESSCFLLCRQLICWREADARMCSRSSHGTGIGSMMSSVTYSLDGERCPHDEHRYRLQPQVPKERANGVKTAQEDFDTGWVYMLPVPLHLTAACRLARCCPRHT